MPQCSTLRPNIFAMSQIVIFDNITNWNLRLNDINGEQGLSWAKAAPNPALMSQLGKSKSKVHASVPLSQAMTLLDAATPLFRLPCNMRCSTSKWAVPSHRTVMYNQGAQPSKLGQNDLSKVDRTVIFNVGEAENSFFASFWAVFEGF